jgi:hypothetical protein
LLNRLSGFLDDIHHVPLFQHERHSQFRLRYRLGVVGMYDNPV